jgi:hypothetical protein
VKTDANQPAPIVIGVQRSRATVARRLMEAGRQRREASWRAAWASLRRRHQSAWLASQSVHQSRATEILNDFDIEVTKVAASSLASFVLHYVCCEALGKLLMGSPNIPPYQIFQNGGQLKIDLKKLNPAVHRFGIPVSDAVLEAIFLSTMDTPGQRSCRVLRNAVLHGLRSDHLAEVNSRITELIKPMTEFIGEVRVRSGAGHIF